MVRGDGDGACEQFYEVEEERYLETSQRLGDGMSYRVFGERGRETEDGEEGLDER